MLKSQIKTYTAIAKIHAAFKTDWLLWTV